jgi:tetratricopeptide (TPR) repeat protein
MRDAKYLLVIGLVVLLAGCASFSRDMRLSNQGYEDILNKNYTQAEKHLTEALAVNPNNPYALINMGVVYENTGRQPQAREMYEKAKAVGSREVPSRTSRDWAKDKPLTDIAEKDAQSVSAGEKPMARLGGSI